jgi:hypothetical protein
LQKKLKFIMSLNCLGKMKFKQQWPQVWCEVQPLHLVLW